MNSFLDVIALIEEGLKDVRLVTKEVVYVLSNTKNKVYKSDWLEEKFKESYSDAKKNLDLKNKSNNSKITLIDIQNKEWKFLNN